MYLETSSLYYPLLINLLIFCTFSFALSKSEALLSLALDFPITSRGVTVFPRWISSSVYLCIFSCCLYNQKLINIFSLYFCLNYQFVLFSYNFLFLIFRLHFLTFWLLLLLQFRKMNMNLTHIFFCFFNILLFWLSSLLLLLLLFFLLLELFVLFN